MFCAFVRLSADVSISKRFPQYNFYRLESHDHHLLLDPTVDIAARGRIPRQPGAFSVQLPCTANLSGIAAFSIGSSTAL